MDSEKFDRIVLDLLYDELDELTRASALRHIDQSSRAKVLYAELRATREVGALPLVEPPADLEERILLAERQARADRSFKQRLGGVISIVAGYAMRPQLGMAAVFLLFLGGSLLFLRARPGDHSAVQVTETGVPESESESVIVAVPETPPASEPEQLKARGAPVEEAKPDEPQGSDRAARSAPPRDEDSDDMEPLAAPMRAAESAREGRAGAEKKAEASSPYADALLAFHEGRYGEARERFDEIARAPGPDAASAALMAARATEKTSGCGAASSRFEQIARRHAATGVGQEARWLASECYRQLGDPERARSGYRELLGSANYDERARQALAGLDTKSEAEASSTAASKPASAAPAK